jgi:hypothetical protein
LVALACRPSRSPDHGNTRDIREFAPGSYVGQVVNLLPIGNRPETPGSEESLLVCGEVP